MKFRALALSAAPLLILIAYIARLGLDIPYWDQWMVVPLLAHMKQGALTAVDLLAQLNEHRPFFPRLFWLGLAQVTGYNTKAELWLNAGLALLTLAVFAAHTAKVWRECGVKSFNSFLPLLALLVFNLAQWESWLFGIQTIMFLGMLAVVAGFIVLAHFNHWRGLLAGALLGIVATFSMANAVLFWPLGGVLVILGAKPTERWARAVAWGMLSLAVLAIFFYGWVPTSNAAVNVLWQRPGIYLLWVLNFLGAPLLTYYGVAWVFGLASLFGLAVWGGRVLQAGRLPLLAPYGVIIFFILVSALAIGVGRSNISLSSSVASRYLTLTVWYWASLFALLPLARISPHWQWAVKALAVVMLCVGMVSGGLLGYYWRYQRTLPAYQALRNGEAATDNQLISISGLPPALVRERLDILCQYEWSVCRK